MSTSESIPLDNYVNFVEEYKKADAAAKKVQAFKLEAGIPAINELRYAAHHVALSLDAGSDCQKENLEKAIRHCQRAAYEAVEAGNLSALELIKSFCDDHKDFDVTKVVTDYVDILAEVEECRAITMEPRATGTDRSSDLTKYWDVFGRLSAASRKLEVARPLIVKAIDDERAAARRFILTTSITVLGIIVALVIGLMMFFKSPSPPTPAPPSGIQQTPVRPAPPVL